MFAVTHVITSTNESNLCKRSFFYLRAILVGAWIVTLDCKHSLLVESVGKKRTCLSA